MNNHIHTKYWPPVQVETGIHEAAAALAAGGVVAFPTETVYGLGGDARSTEAVERIFAAKGRPSDNPLIVHLASAEEVNTLASALLPLERRLMAAFWPGPLTLVLPVRPDAVSTRVTAGLDTVAVRVPAHETARRLIAAAGCPIAAPSANRSGRPSPTQAQHVLDDLDGRIDGVLDGGPTGVGLESTVVRVLDDVVHVLRPGGVTAEQLQAVLGADARVSCGDEHAAVAPEDAAKLEAPSGIDAPDVLGGDAFIEAEAERELFRNSPGAVTLGNGEASSLDVSAVSTAPRSPGVKYTHYAPQGDMVVVTGKPAAMREAVQAAVAAAQDSGMRTAVLSCDEHVGEYRADLVLGLGSRDEPQHAAQQLYAALRECDARGIAFIAAEGYPEDGIGAALMNRMHKAAGGRILPV